MYFKLHLTPEAKTESVARIGVDKFAVSVKDKAKGNLANRRALDLLAEHLKVPSAQIRIVGGHHAPHKIVFIREL